MTPGWNQPPTATPNQPPIGPPPGAPTQFQGWLNDGITQRDHLAGFFDNISTSFNRPLILVMIRDGVQVDTPLSPLPHVSRVGSKSKPYRLLSGQEIQLSEDDIRVHGISKRYRLDQIWQWGLVYILDPQYLPSGLVDLERSTVCELVYIDDSSPITWTLNLRKRSDSRMSAIDYDLP